MFGGLGDVTSTMACAITASKNAYPVRPCRKGRYSAPGGLEDAREINRLAHRCRNSINLLLYHFRCGHSNLKKSGSRRTSGISFVGNTMIDTLPQTPPKIFKNLRVGMKWVWKKRNYIVLTLAPPL